MKAEVSSLGNNIIARQEVKELVINEDKKIKNLLIEIAIKLGKVIERLDNINCKLENLLLLEAGKVSKRLSLYEEAKEIIEKALQKTGKCGAGVLVYNLKISRNTAIKYLRKYYEENKGKVILRVRQKEGSFLYLRKGV